MLNPQGHFGYFVPCSDSTIVGSQQVSNFYIIGENRMLHSFELNIFFPLVIAKSWIYLIHL